MTNESLIFFYDHLIIIYDNLVIIYGKLDRIHIVILFLGFMLNLIYIINNRNKENYFYQMITTLKKLICTFKKYPLLTLVIGIFILLLFLLLQIIFHFVGLTVISDTWLLFHICLFTRFTFVKLLISLVTLPFTKDINIWYNHLGMAPFIPLFLVPFSLISYEIILPIITGGFLINLQNVLINIKNILFMVIKVVDEYLVEFHNFLGLLPKNMLTFAEWEFNYPLKSISRKRFLPIDYTDFNKLSPSSVRIRDKIRHWNFAKSMKYPSPVNIAVPVHGLKGGSDLFRVKGSLENLISFISKNSTDIIHKISLLNIPQTDIYLEDENITLKLELDNKLLKMQIISSNSKVLTGQGSEKFNDSCDRKSFSDPINGLNRIFNQRDELTRLTTFKGSDTDLIVRMEHHVIYDNPEIEGNNPEYSSDNHIVSSITGYPLIESSADYPSVAFAQQMPACEVIGEQQSLSDFNSEQNTTERYFASSLEAQDTTQMNFTNTLQVQEPNNYDPLNMDYNFNGLPINFTNELEIQQGYHSKEYPLNLSLNMGGSSVSLHTTGLNKEDISSSNIDISGNQSNIFAGNIGISDEDEDHSMNLIGISGGNIGLSIHDMSTFNENRGILTEEKGPSIEGTSILEGISNRDALETPKNPLDSSGENVTMPELGVDFSGINQEYLYGGNQNFNSHGSNLLGINSYSMDLPPYNISTLNDGSNLHYPSSSQSMISGVDQDINLHYAFSYPKDFTQMNYNNTPSYSEKIITKEDMISFSSIKAKIQGLIKLENSGVNKRLSTLKFQNKILAKHFFNVALKSIYPHSTNTNNILIDNLLLSLDEDKFNDIQPYYNLDYMELTAKNNILNNLDIGGNYYFNFINMEKKILNLLECSYVFKNDGIRELPYQSKGTKSIFYTWAKLVTGKLGAKFVRIEDIVNKLNVRTSPDNLAHYQEEDANDLHSWEKNTILKSDLKSANCYKIIADKIHNLLSRNLIQMDDKFVDLPYNSKARQLFLKQLRNLQGVTLKNNSLEINELKVNHLLTLLTPS